MAGGWEPHLSPSEFRLAGDPLAVVYESGQGDFISILSTSDKNALLEFRVQGDSVDSGTLRAGPRDIIVLEDDPDTNGTYFVHITDGPGQGASGTTVRRINSTLSRNEFTVLTQPLDDPPTTDTEYDLLRQIISGTVQSATANSVELEAGDGGSVDDGDFILVGDELRLIPSAPAVDTVTVSGVWANTPNAGETYRILRVEDAQARAQARSARLAVLAASASGSNNEYNDLFLEITSRPGQTPDGRQIEDYFGATRLVVMAEDFPSPPDDTSDYRITVSSVSQGWFTYKEPNQTELRPELSWEYWNGRGFVGLPVVDKTENFLVGGTVEFTLPEDVGKTEVAGQENFWIRARIVGGDYGRELFTVDPDTGRITIEKDPIRPPLIKELSIEYEVTEFQQPQFCLTLNNLNYLDQTAANSTENKNFLPFVPLDDQSKTLYFGFNQPLKGEPDQDLLRRERVAGRRAQQAEAPLAVCLRERLERAARGRWHRGVHPA